jgi:small subunit ribosomal protein S17
MSPENAPNRKAPRTRQGVVLSRNMEKTAVVAIERTTMDPLYHKRLRRRTKFKVHDEKNETHKGDVVLIAETRPISRDKHWKLVKILKKAQQVAEANI